MRLWGEELPEHVLSEAERSFLARFAAMPRPQVEQIWRELDVVWIEMGLGRSVSPDALARYYAHPVWLLNGVFVATDPISVAHRRAIARWLVERSVRRVADYGGGFGQLASAIVEASPAIEVDVVEPFPSQAGRFRIAGLPRVALVDRLAGPYDAVIAEDVLEHVEDPIALAAELARAVAPGGNALFANAFYPFIHCHLPQTFHLRHTFAWVVAPLGLRFVGRVTGAAHALAFRREPRAPDLGAARARERVSRAIGPWVNRLRGAASAVLRRTLS
ncbi:MAG: class I SAM-dependent methyltransferase [Betaproteobacteria bacterium]|nr:MAG: class I SAM-dependent methyltransferase [Betaproteobacteria bacterium]